MPHHPSHRPSYRPSTDDARRPSALALLVALVVALPLVVAAPATADDAPAPDQGLVDDAPAPGQEPGGETPSPAEEAPAPALAPESDPEPVPEEPASPEPQDFDVAPDPTVTGTAAVGTTLTVVTGDWSPAATFTYRWLADGLAVDGATSTSYVPTAADLGKVLTVEVTGAADGRTPQSRSTSTAPVAAGTFATTPVPTVSGTARVGSTLTAQAGAWPAGATLTYQWSAAGTPVAGATQATYAVTPADLGAALTVQVTATQTGWATASRTSLPTSAVAAATFTSAPVPTVTGTAKVGSTLTAVPGAWSPAATFTYQWSVGGTPVAGATRATFVPLAADLGRTITVKVTGTLAGWTPVTRTSVKTAAVAPATFTTAPVPTISGKVRVGSALSAVPGTWSPSATLAYQWRVGGVAVKGATKKTYTPAAGDLGKRITVQVTGTRTGWTTRARTSASSAPVALGAFTAAPVPTVTGTVRAGSTLTAKAGSWSPGAKLTYQWKANGSTIKGATASKFTPTAQQVGTRITVQVTGTRTGWTTTKKTSAATRAVAAGVFAKAPTPKISGTARTGSTLTATAGTWSPSATLSYQWLAGGTPVTGARSTTFVPTTSQVGKKITVQVTARKDGWTTTSRTSAATAAVTTPAVVPSGDGIFRVGSQISPGTYISKNPDFCYWERRSNATDDLEGIIANDIGNGQRIVTISPNDKYFSSDWCGGWKPLPTTGTPKTSVTQDGVYAVGTQLAPGRYRALGTGDFCYYSVVSSFSGELDAIRINGFSAYTQEVVITSRDVGFESSNCSTWRKVG
ncbi:hypothetical protein [Sanguibacter keddieii]|uniref:hypothetical protein n=1 Tax=Sanguibacter keddieii TaxID=60920 RepID=UPI00145F79FA|nr:hypothetical protein [Sanguibacter keddieii]